MRSSDMKLRFRPIASMSLDCIWCRAFPLLSSLKPSSVREAPLAPDHIEPALCSEVHPPGTNAPCAYGAFSEMHSVYTHQHHLKTGTSGRVALADTRSEFEHIWTVLVHSSFWVPGDTPFPIYVALLLLGICRISKFVLSTFRWISGGKTHRATRL